MSKKKEAAKAAQEAAEQETGPQQAGGDRRGTQAPAGTHDPKNVQDSEYSKDSKSSKGFKHAKEPKNKQTGQAEQQVSAEQQAPAEQQASAEQQTSAEQPSAEQRVSVLEAELQQLQEALLRKQADFENYRRRMQKDKQETIQFANRSLITDLLEVLDSFERALRSHEDEKESNPQLKSLFEGLELVEKQLANMLSNRWGLKPIQSVGCEFDPQVHEALMMEESSEYKAATVVESFQTGYTLHDRVLRPARVKVAQPSD